MHHGTMLFHRLESFEYSVSSLTVPTPYSCFMNIQKHVLLSFAFFQSVTCENHVTVCTSCFMYHTFGCFLIYLPISFDFICHCTYSIPACCTLCTGVHFPKRQWLLTFQPHSTTFAFTTCFPLMMFPIKECFFWPCLLLSRHHSLISLSMGCVLWVPCPQTILTFMSASSVKHSCKG